MSGREREKQEKEKGSREKENDRETDEEERYSALLWIQLYPVGLLVFSVVRGGEGPMKRRVQWVNI